MADSDGEDMWNKQRRRHKANDHYIVYDSARVMTSYIYARLALTNRLPRGWKHSDTVFDAAHVPAVRVVDYVVRICQFSPEPFYGMVCAAAYIERYLRRNPVFRVTFRNAHRLILTSFVVAIKCIADKYYSNAYMARVGGVPTPELNDLEIVFLAGIDFALYIPNGASAWNATREIIALANSVS